MCNVHYYIIMLKKIFRTVERLAKTDIKYLARGSFWLFTNYAITTIVTFLLAISFANLLPKETFGNYRFALSLAAIVGSFTLTGLNLAVIRDVSRGVSNLLKNSFKTQMRWSILTFLASLSLGGYYFLQDNITITLSLVIMGVFLPITSSALVYTSYWEGKKDYKRVAIFSIITTLVYSITLFIVIHITTSVPIIVFFYFAIQAGSAYLFYRISLKYDVPTHNESPEKTINFGKHLSFLNILATLAGQLDKILIFHYLGAAQLAVYVLSQIPLSQCRSIFKQIAQTVYPRYSERTISDIRSTIYRKMFLLTIPLSLVVIMYILLAPYVFNLFFPKYLDAVLYSQVAMLSLLFFQKKLIAYTALVHASKKQLYTMSIFSSVFKIGLLFLLLPHYGIWGAIFTDLLIHALGLISSVLLLRRF